MTTPSVVLSERAILAHLLWHPASGPQVWSRLAVLDFPNHAGLACILHELRDQAFDPPAVMSLVLNRGLEQVRAQLVDLTNFPANGGSLDWHVKQLSADSVRRNGIAAATRLAQQLETADDPIAMLAQGIVDLDILQLTGTADDAIAGVLGIDELCVEGDAPPPWIIPGVLRRKERFVVTGEEGFGKSMLVRQFAVGAAAGLSPFTLRGCTPARVLVIDCENDREQSRDIFHRLYRFAIERGRQAEVRANFHIEFHTGGIDLAAPRDVAVLRTVCEIYQPELLVIGPLYQMHRGDASDEQSARVIKEVLDSLRSSIGCAIVSEAHSAHGYSDKGGAESRNLRPFGSSLWRRWPDFGKGLQRIEPDDDMPESDWHGRQARLVSWRGDRRTDRIWPATLHGVYDDALPSCWGWVENLACLSLPSAPSRYEGSEAS